MKRIMYIEQKEQDGLDGPGRIGWVELARSRRAYLYGGRRLRKVIGFKHNCVDAETGEMFWISGPKKNGEDKLYGGVVEIDEDAREEYWRSVRGRPDRVTDRLIVLDNAQQSLAAAGAIAWFSSNLVPSVGC